MYEDIALTQSGGWVSWVYLILSAILFVIFLMVKAKQKSISSLIKIVCFFVMIAFAIAQFFVFRFGLSGIYNWFGYFPQDSLYIRYVALFFCCAYAFFLPVRNIQK